MCALGEHAWDIGAADAASGNPDDDMAWNDLWPGTALDTDVAWGVKDGCAHDLISHMSYL
jgi:hypothetical protein